MSRKDVSLVSTFIGAVPWVTIRNPNQKRPGEKEPGTFHYNPGNMSGKTEEKRQDMDFGEKTRTETKANRSTNGVLKVQLPGKLTSGIRQPSPTSRSRHHHGLGERHWS